MSVEQEFRWACNTPRDLHEHLPYLADLASRCRHVTEFGIGFGMSDRAFLYGLQRPGCRLTSYDIRITPEAKRLSTLSSICQYRQIEANVLDVQIAQTDLLFIDTLHNFEQLWAELSLHAGKVSRMIVLHDTVTFGHRDEIPLSGSVGLGLMPAVLRFIDTHCGWDISEHRLNCNGLTVVERKA